MYDISKVKDIEIRPITKEETLYIVLRNHYSKIMPKLTKHFLGGFINGELVAAITLGWGVRPVHTIRILFPSLDTKDYYEIGKMCLIEELPKNSESIFLSKVIQYTKEKLPHIKVIFTWADGILGKPGYVYQAANFLYGGYIMTDLYLGSDGEKIHPRTSQRLSRTDDTKYGRRPTVDFMEKNNWTHWKGKQFRYILFTCDKRERKKLLRESPFEWSINYPKDVDLIWQYLDFDTRKWITTTDILPYNKDSGLQFNRTAIENLRIVKTMERAKKFFW